MATTVASEFSTCRSTVADSPSVLALPALLAAPMRGQTLDLPARPSPADGRRAFRFMVYLALDVQ